MIMLCDKDKDGIATWMCQARPATEHSTIPGVKFWCFRCGRYVIPDENHELLFDRKLMKMQSGSGHNPCW